MSVRWVSLIRLLPLAGHGLPTAAVALNLALGALPIVSLVGMSVLLQRVHSVASNWSTAFALAVGALLLQQLLTPFQAAIAEVVARQVAVTALLIRFGQRGSLARFGTMWDGLAGYRRRVQYLRGIATGSEAAKEIRVLGLLGWIRGRTGAAATEYMRMKL